MGLVFDILGNLAFLLIAFSYLVRDIFRLRVLSIIASAGGVAFNYFAPQEPLWIVINWNLVFISVNAYQIYVIIRERKEVKFTVEEKEIYERVFRNLTPVEFMRLLKVSEWQTLKQGTIIIERGKKVVYVGIIYDGKLSILVDDKVVAQLGKGSFIGEMSFITGNMASATVVVEEDSHCLLWKQETLHNLLDHDQTLKNGVQTAFGADLSKKLTKK
ncbi:MAG: cyclic nucleotide-binding domain-containing protein [Chloroherpetonaceae bacterium]|nr:cyclic nucleotide-binding domain-containing protein [Chloroherpetonaceae bacterium]